MSKLNLAQNRAGRQCASGTSPPHTFIIAGGSKWTHFHSPFHYSVHQKLQPNANGNNLVWNILEGWGFFGEGVTFFNKKSEKWWPTVKYASKNIFRTKNRKTSKADGKSYTENNNRLRCFQLKLFSGDWTEGWSRIVDLFILKNTFKQCEFRHCSLRFLEKCWKGCCKCKLPFYFCIYLIQVKVSNVFGGTGLGNYQQALLKSCRETACHNFSVLLQQNVLLHQDISFKADVKCMGYTNGVPTCHVKFSCSRPKRF